MEDIGFFMESSLGDLEVRLLRDGWTRIEFQDPGEDPVIIEDIIRTDADLAAALESLGIPKDEAAELAKELWDELDETEQTERADTPGPRRDPFQE